MALHKYWSLDAAVDMIPAEQRVAGRSYVSNPPSKSSLTTHLGSRPRALALPAVPGVLTGLRLITANMLLAAGWFVLAIATAPPAAPRTSVALIYLSPGLGLGCVLAFGRQLGPGIALGALVTGMWREMPLAWLAMVTLAAPLQALVCARLLRAERPFAHISTTASALRFFLVTLLPAPLIVLIPLLPIAILGGLMPGAVPPQVATAVSPEVVVASWLGLAFGLQIVAPAVLVLADRDERTRLWETPWRTVTVAVVAPVVVGLALLAPGLTPLTRTLALLLPAAVLALAALQLPASGLALTSTVLLGTTLIARAQSSSFPPGLPFDVLEILGFWAGATFCVLSLTMVAIFAERESLQHKMDDERRLTLAQLARRAEFLAVLSHELRTPLTSVLLAVDLLIESTLDAEQRDLADTVARAGDSLRALIDDSLALSRAENRRVEIHSRPTLLHELLEEVAVVLGEPARRRGLTIRLDAAPDIPQPFATDPNLVRRVLLNLVGNAVKYGSPGEILLQARTEPVAPPHAKADSDGATGATIRSLRNLASPSRVGIRLEIADDGPGIPAERQADIFEPFARLEEEKLDHTLVPGGGTGLGLAITRELVHHLGGQIGVRDRDHQPGTVFWVVLPPRPDDTNAPGA